jgi:hypothetical protein
VKLFKKMRTLSQRLIKEETLEDGGEDSAARAAFRICEKLRAPLSTFTGVAGFGSLLSRALALAKPKAPWLEGLQLKPDGSFNFTAEREARLHTAEAVSGGAELVTQLLELLATFIGEALTLRLVQNVWPNAADQNLKSKRTKK